RYARIDLRDDPQRKERKAHVAQMTVEKKSRTCRRDRALEILRTGKARRDDGTHACANGIRQEIQRACDPLRKKHLQRFHRKRKNRADDRAKRDTPEWRCAYWKPR